MISQNRSLPARIAFALLFGLFAMFGTVAQATAVLTTIGPDSFGVGAVVTQLDGSGSPTVLFTLPDGSVSYNGLSYRSTDSRFYALANDAFGMSSLVSFDDSGPASLSVVAGLGAGFVGMTYQPAGDAFYAAKTSLIGDSELLRVSTSGATSLIGPLGFAFMGGLAFGSSPDLLYGIAADASGVQRVLNEIDLNTGTATALFNLGDGSLAFNGGLAWDDTTGLFQVIGSNFLGNSSLYRFDLTGASSLAVVGDIGPGYLNASLASVPGSNAVPAPGTLSLVLAALLGASVLSLSSPQRRTYMRFAPALRNAFFAALAVVAGTAHAQFSSPIRNVENPDRFPYQERGSTTINVNVLNNFISFPTPAGKRYIIEYVSVSCNSPSGSDSFPQVLVQVPRITGPNAVIFMQANAVPMERRGPAPFGGFIYAGSASMKLYADALPFDPTGGNGILLNIFHSDFSVSSTCTALVSGHTITP